MLDFTQPWLIAGVLLGLSSSLHCVGMCSGIAGSLALAATPQPSARPLIRAGLVINAGRISGYVVAGALVGAIGSAAFGALDRSALHLVLRWAAAVSLSWIGLSMIGLVPLPEILQRAGAWIGGWMLAAAGSMRLPAPAGLFLGGALWGFLPCAMVYAALFYAMLTGSWLGGATVMLGFGLGTLPPVLGVGLAVPLFRRLAAKGWMRAGVGAAIIALGVGSAAVPAATFLAWCGLA